ncbi:hypothetical protein [Bacillus mycoides]|uniref:Uncharacterized protein n=2 Tax=Bacillaceae TaxID=186817 RepID=A0A1E8BG74_BACMY|nr:hypothetical protein [Bacillus mycoides]OFD36845.1 hypothetical protein BWGOE2_51930 [Bacillus mycoides]OFD88215.1 hypothetical protein BWGOE11_53150 [Bacillus mycoides]OFD92547.1 hypothetical protein BWGOE13_52350 [Bacillus mycoides]
MHRAFLKTEVSSKTNEVIIENQLLLRKNLALFNNMDQQLKNISNELHDSFESQTGAAIQRTLEEHKHKIGKKLFIEHMNLSNSCGKK